MIDLHMHSTYSDGLDSVESLLRQAEKNKLDIISITDHNTLNAYKNEITDCKKYFSGEIVKGCEVSTMLGKNVIEILAYGIDIYKFDGFLAKYFSDEKKIEMLKRGLEFLYKKADEKGLVCDKVPFESLKLGDHLPRIFNGEISRHPENKALYMEDAWGNNTAFVKNYLINSKSEWHLETNEEFPNTEEAIDEIHNAGGLAFVAHPYEYPIENFYKTLEKIRELGIDGIEVFHVSALGREERLLEYAKENNLYISGGSDYHRAGHPIKNSLVGGENSKQVIEKSIVENWVEGDMFYE